MDRGVILAFYVGGLLPMLTMIIVTDGYSVRYATGHKVTPWLARIGLTLLWPFVLCWLYIYPHD